MNNKTHVVYIDGVFDLFHLGHLTHLKNGFKLTFK